MSELEAGQTWNVTGSELDVIETNDLGEVKVEWPSGEQTWEDQTWLTVVGEEV